MTLDLLLRNPAPPVTPGTAGWRWLSYSSTTVAGSAGVDTGPDEVCLVNLGGRLSATVAGERFDLGTRETPLNGLPDALYLPPGTTCTVEGEGWLARCAARADRDQAGAVQPIAGSSMRVEVRGSGNATRQITHIIPPEFAAHRLLVVEVSTPAGNWSSYPPHKHEVERLPIENDLEEVYAYRFAAPEGFGVQRLYTRDGSLDETWTVRDGDVVLVPRGYHPFCAAHGYHGYYLNALAAERRSMAAEDDPELAWTRGTWANMERDPRAPLTGKETP
ncbi:MAG TPA: 5-deoxy-glucuronate isomerase [Gaiellales bacterium]|nr:5-deoxy-glucuronate isomerase [Gaiellales bacterium]